MGISNFSTSGLKPGVCTSTTRPTAPYEGMMIYETDTDKVLVWNGSAWLYTTTPQTLEPGAWTTYTAWSILQPGNVGTLTYNYSKYTVVNKVLTWNAHITVPAGSAGISGNRITISGYPITPASASSIIGYFYFLESGVQHRAGTIHSDGSTSNFVLWADGSGNALGASYALKANDQLRFSVTYEVS